MIRLLILIIIATIVLAVAFSNFKTISTKKKLIAAFGVIGAAAAGISLQAFLPLVQSLLAIVAIALIASWLFVKELEKEKLQKQLQAEKRRSKIPVDTPVSEPEIIPSESTPEKSFAMQSITPDRKEL